MNKVEEARAKELGLDVWLEANPAMAEKLGRGHTVRDLLARLDAIKAKAGEVVIDGVAWNDSEKHLESIIALCDGSVDP